MVSADVGFEPIGRTRWLAGWLAVGLVWWLLGMQLLPSNKLYHQGLILLFWLPGLVALVMESRVRHGWSVPLLSVLLVLSLWAVLSVGWGGDSDRLKVVAYSLLAANAWVALGALDARLLWRTLAYSSLVGGLLAWGAVLNFYGLEDRRWYLRVVGTGHLDHTILAAHVMGVLGVLLACLRRELPPMLRRWAWLPALLGYLAFLLLSRSKGPWLALLCTFLALLFIRPSRGRFIALMALIGAIVLAVLCAPQWVLRGGFSYRPELLAVGWQTYLAHPITGLGIGAEYLLQIAGGTSTFKHAHNFYLHLAIQVGGVGLALWLLLQAGVVSEALRIRRTIAGRTLLAVAVFGAVALFTDGIGPWVKPREDWFTSWLPLFLCLALHASKASVSAAGASRLPRYGEQP